MKLSDEQRRWVRILAQMFPGIRIWDAERGALRSVNVTENTQEEHHDGKDPE